MAGRGDTADTVDTAGTVRRRSLPCDTHSRRNASHRNAGAPTAYAIQRSAAPARRALATRGCHGEAARSRFGCLRRRNRLCALEATGRLRRRQRSNRESFSREPRSRRAARRSPAERATSFLRTKQNCPRCRSSTRRVSAPLHRCRGHAARHWKSVRALKSPTRALRYLRFCAYCELLLDEGNRTPNVRPRISPILLLEDEDDELGTTAGGAGVGSGAGIDAGAV